MIRHISLGGLEQISDLVSHFFDLLKFREIGLAAIEEVAILIQECRYVALQIFDLEVAWRFVARGCFPFLLCCRGFFLLNERYASRPVGGRILLIGFSIRAPIERRCR